MVIAIIGTGNVGGTLAKKWASAGHEVRLGVRDMSSFKGEALLGVEGISAYPTQEAIAASDVVVLATPATAAVSVAKSLGDTAGKVIIDTMNIVMGRGPEGYSNTSTAVLENTDSTDVVKCFNTTGYNNMENPVYEGMPIDMFTCGDSAKGKQVAQQLALDAGFGACYDVGGNDRFELMEQFAFFWINLAMFQGQGREMGFKLFKR